MLKNIIMTNLVHCTEQSNWRGLWVHVFIKIIWCVLIFILCRYCFKCNEMTLFVIHWHQKDGKKRLIFSIKRLTSTKGGLQGAGFYKWHRLLTDQFSLGGQGNPIFYIKHFIIVGRLTILSRKIEEYIWFGYWIGTQWSIYWILSTKVCRGLLFLMWNNYQHNLLRQNHLMAERKYVTTYWSWHVNLSFFL